MAGRPVINSSSSASTTRSTYSLTGLGYR
jgi:hypothetical protein